MILKDYYALMEVPPRATQEEIHRAYKRLAKKWHPDRNRDPMATERMQEINEAFQILRDPIKRTRYDEAYTRSFGKTNEERGHATESNNSAYERRPVDPVVDEQLESWITEARRKAREMVHFTVEETGNMLTEGLDWVKGYLIGFAIFSGIGLLLVLTRSCGN